MFEEKPSNELQAIFRRQYYASNELAPCGCDGDTAHHEAVVKMKAASNELKRRGYEFDVREGDDSDPPRFWYRPVWKRR